MANDNFLDSRRYCSVLCDHADDAYDDRTVNLHRGQLRRCVSWG